MAPHEQLKLWEPSADISELKWPTMTGITKVLTNCHCAAGWKSTFACKFGRQRAVRT